MRRPREDHLVSTIFMVAIDVYQVLLLLQQLTGLRDHCQDRRLTSNSAKPSATAMERDLNVNLNADSFSFREVYQPHLQRCFSHAGAPRLESQSLRDYQIILETLALELMPNSGWI